MKDIDRSILTIRAKKPFLDWLHSVVFDLVDKPIQAVE